MSEPFIGEIRMFAGNFAPRNWAFCDGQLLAVSQNDALFSLLGTIYGGDGRTTFGLPDLRGRVPMHTGSGPGLSTHRLGEKSGTENTTVTVSQLPSHSHLQAEFQATGNPADSAGPGANSLAMANIYNREFPSVPLHPDTVTADTSSDLTGGSQSHANMPPYLAVHFIIALFGVYPSRH